jgi:hypothetical protein
MRNFFELADGVNVKPVLEELVRFPNLWNKFPVRKLSDQKSYDDVVLRFQRFDKDQDLADKVQTNLDVVNYPGFEFLTKIKPLVFGLMAQVSGEHLGAVVVGRIGPGQSTESKSDRFEEAEVKFPDRIPPAYYYERYVLGLSGGGGIIECDQAVVQVPPGKVFWFNNQLPWGIANTGPDEFQFLLVDVALSRNWYYPQ